MAAAEHRMPNTTLVALREHAGLSQQDLADELTALAAGHHKYPQITRKTIGRWERGEVTWPQPFYRRLLAEFFRCAGDELGFFRPARARPNTTTVSTTPFTLETAPVSTDPRVTRNHDEWRHIRTEMGQHRRALAVLAASLYPDHHIPGLANTGAISCPPWLPDTPVPLDNVALSLDPAAPSPEITGGEPASAHTRPLSTSDSRYRRYHAAMRDLAPPRLFENRLCFRLLNANWTRPHLRFGHMGFFDAIDTNEALAHEFAAHHLVEHHGSTTVAGRASTRRLAFRKHLGDPCDLAQRPLMGAIGTLTIRAGTSPSIILHHRDAASVAGGGGMIHLLPAGIFQPCSLNPDSASADFSLWRNIQREYAEELLGHDEHDGSGHPIDYAQQEPFKTMDHARHHGTIRAYCLGITLDALTLAADILTVTIIEPDAYDTLFAHAVDTNHEGTLPARAFPFEEHTLTWLHHTERLSPGAAAALHLTWKHRHSLIN